MLIEIKNPQILNADFGWDKPLRNPETGESDYSAKLIRKNIPVNIKAFNGDDNKDSTSYSWYESIRPIRNII
jgi:hypothetical protein